MAICPECGTATEKLISPDPQLVYLLQSSDIEVPAQACFACMLKLKNGVSLRGSSRLLAESKGKDDQKLRLWRSRVKLIKSGRTLMNYKKFADAAQAYERYIKILEIVYDLKDGDELRPELFKDSARTQELTIITSVYWDLLRIYDTQYKFRERQMTAANQLAKFAVVTPIFPDILRKAHTFVRKANNGAAIRQFIRKASKSSKCFIATSAFESPVAPEVIILRKFRDKVLKQSWLGKNLIWIYYRLSPTIANGLDRWRILKTPVRFLLRKVSDFLRAFSTQ